MKRIPQDIIGSIAILKFKKNTPFIIKKFRAWRFLKKHKNITTVLEKTEKVSGRLRKITTRHLAGARTKETTYRENECLFSLNVDETYFSPRLSNERKIMADAVEKRTKKKGTKILVMFAGVAPFPITIARRLKRAKKNATIISSELNKKATAFAKKNIEMNKVEDYVRAIGGDSKNIGKKVRGPFDVIIMPRPNLKETFLKTALALAKKGTTIFYHGFGTKQAVKEEIAREAGKKIGPVKIRKAGDIAPYEFRWLAEFKIK